MKTLICQIDAPTTAGSNNLDLVGIQPNYTNIDASNDDDVLVDEQFDPDQEFNRELQIFEREIENFSADPNKLLFGEGPDLLIGFDSEYVSPGEGKLNTYLSLQFYIVGEGGTHTKIVYPKGPLKTDRPAFYPTMVRLLQECIDKGVIREWPRKVILCGFFLRTDLAAFGDMDSFKRQLDTASGKVTTVGKPVTYEPGSPDEVNPLKRKLVIVKDAIGTDRAVTVRFVDIGSHVAVGTTLAEMGRQIGLPKLLIPEGHSIERMDVLLKEDKVAFEEYGLRDAEIAARYFHKLEVFALKYADVKSLPATASGLAVKIFTAQMKKKAVDFNHTFGLQETLTTYWNTANSQVLTKKSKVPSAMRSIVEPFVTSCYHGGRNECYAFGPTPVSVWYDFDLAGAYTTGLVDLRYIDYEKFWYTKDERDFVGHVLGFALVEFKFPADTKYPCLPVEGSNGGLFYPLSGRTYCSAPEIEVALGMHCSLKILHGVIIPWLPSDHRIFESFTTGVRDLRRSFTKGSPDELYAKLIGNALYGKTAQGLKKKTVFDTHGMKSIDLPHSQITNSLIAAHTTGFIRAVLSEQIANVPEGRTVISATTDGFITDAELAELDLTGPMATRYQALCERVAPGTPMLEMKHKVRQLVAVKTRGQITAIPFEGEKSILAKAGVSPSVSVDQHNDFMLELFLNRQPGQKTTSKPFTSIREQWKQDSDVVRSVRHSTLNLEYDFKRNLLEVSVLQVGEIPHISLNSKPWNSVEQAERTRAIHSGWRRQHCMRQMSDWLDWSEHIGFSTVRDVMRAAGLTQTVRITKKGLIDIFRRMFLRAFTQGLCGVDKSMTYAEVASWLTAEGYPTKVEELKNAKRAKFIEHVIPKLARMEEFGNVLLKQFSTIELSKFYVQ